MAQHDQQYQWQQIIESLNGRAGSPAAQFMSEGPNSDFPAFDLEFEYNAPDPKHQQNQQELVLLTPESKVLASSGIGQGFASNKPPQPQHHQLPLPGQYPRALDRKSNYHPYMRRIGPRHISSPLALSQSETTCQDFSTPQLLPQQQKEKVPDQNHSIFNQSALSTQCLFPTSQATISCGPNLNNRFLTDIFAASTTSLGLSNGNESDTPPPPPPAETVDKIERGRRVHREAEKQRRESLRIGFEKLKDLLPDSIIESDKNWSHTRLLEQGLLYIFELKKEANAKLEENVRLKEAVRRAVSARKKESSGL
jgi:hypothetical protein